MSDTLTRPREGANGTPATTPEPAPAPLPNTPEQPKHDPMLDLLRKLERIAATVGSHDPAMAAGLTQLVKRSAEPGATAQPLFRTHVAYMLQDVEKMAGATAVTVPDELRAELTRLAGTSPGLFNPRMEALVRGTPDVSDRGLIRDVRRNAAAVAAMGEQQNAPQAQDVIEVLENRIRLAARFAGPAPASADFAVDRSYAGAAGAKMTEQPGPAGDEPRPAVSKMDGRVRAATSPGDDLTKTPPVLREAVTKQQFVGHAVQTAPPAVGKPKGLMSTIMSNANRLSTGSPEPWEPPAVAMMSRVQSFQERLAAGRTDQHIRAAEKSGEALMNAMETFVAGPGAGVMTKIDSAATNEPGGLSKVMAELQPGGRHANLRTEFDKALQQDPVFAASFNAVEKAALRYGEDRLTLLADSRARKLDASQLNQRFDRADAEIGAAAEKIPGRSPGQSIMAEMADKIGEILSKAVERVRQMVAREPEAGPKPSFSPA